MLRKMGSFRSYVGLEEYELKHPPVSEQDKLQPSLLHGELVISEALNVLQFTSLCKRKGLSGSLFVTNGRVIFVSSDNHKIEESVPLLSLNTLWYYEHSKGSEGSKKHRHVVKLGAGPSSTNSIILSGSTRVHEISIGCSTFKSFRFSFKFSPIDHGLRICNAIIHHSFPVQFERLFYFDYAKATASDWRKQPVNKVSINVPSYFEKGNWFTELNVTRCNPGYRISTANEGFALCGSLPEWIVVPADLIDLKVKALAEKLKGNRPPHWSWANWKGAGILRMSKLFSDNDRLRKAHPTKLRPEIVDLDQDLPSKDIRVSFNKLFELCCPESLLQVDDTDSKFLSSLEQTRWMTLISSALGIAKRSADLIASEQYFIVLQEQESRDTACLCSSLIQIIVDSRFRTVSGFFSLIQKEWLAFGHPFHSEYRHASPIFLLFLDCVQQLLLQNIVEFEFNDKLLANTWDSLFDSTRGTFLFDSPEQRKKMDIWRHTAWDIILSDDEIEDQTLFLPIHSFHQSTHSSVPISLIPNTLMNPMFKLKSFLYPPKPTSSSYQISTTLICSSSLCDLQFWSNLYLNRTRNSSNYSVIEILSQQRHNNLVLPSTAVSTPSSTESRETSFVFPNPSRKPKYYCLGRDPTKELKIVESMLAALSNTTKYIRRSPNTTPTRSGISRSSVMRDGTEGNNYAVSPKSVPTTPSRTGITRNAFIRDGIGGHNSSSNPSISQPNNAQVKTNPFVLRDSAFNRK